MLKNYLKIAIRNLYKNLSYSTINILGLAIGLSCCILIGIYVKSELSYDKFHVNAENTYRVNTTFSSAGVDDANYVTPTALMPTAMREFNEVRTGVRLFDVAMFSPVNVSNEVDVFQERRFLYADSTFFDVFSFNLIEGNPTKALARPNTMIVTESTADKYFGNVDPMGKVLKVDEEDYLITGVVKNVPENSHFKFDFLASFSSIRASKSETWWSANYSTYLVLDENSDKNKLGLELEQMARKSIGDENFADGERMIYDLFPMLDIHLNSELPSEMQPQNDIKYVYLISFIGILILVIACINYMNLATARSTDRAREVGMRKVLGAFKKQLFYQFMGESFIITIMSAVLALIIVIISLLPFNQLTGKDLNFSDLMNAEVIFSLSAIIVVVSFLAGAYPALSLSSFKPGEVLKGSFKRSKSGTVLRKILVTLQFSISILLIISTLVIYKQLNYLQDKKLGYNKDNVLIISTDREINKNFEKIKTELERRNDVVGVSIASDSPTDIGGGYNLTVPGTPANSGMNVTAGTIDKDYLKTMGMELIAGRSFTDTDVENSTLDSVELRNYSFIVNEETLKYLMLSSDEAIGHTASLHGRQGKIVGVVKDFHFASLHQKINPLVLFIDPYSFNNLLIRINSINTPQTLSELKTVWDGMISSSPFIYTFMDQEYAALYVSEQRLGNIFVVFAFLAIFIACLGLLGLVSFTVQQRNKEIGVRKVLGATVPSLFLLISKDFTKLILLAFVIAAPVGYYFMNEWLSSFVYQSGVGVMPIVVSVILTIVIAMITISFQSIKAAMANPVDSLRSE